MDPFWPILRCVEDVQGLDLSAPFPDSEINRGGLVATRYYYKYG